MGARKVTESGDNPTSNPRDLEKGQPHDRHGSDSHQIRFTALCPKCKSEAIQGPHSKQTLRERHCQNILEFYCDSCDHQWEPTIGEKANVMRLID
jgi:hypothetical protein